MMQCLCNSCGKVITDLEFSERTVEILTIGKLHERGENERLDFCVSCQTKIKNFSDNGLLLNGICKTIRTWHKLAHEDEMDCDQLTVLENSTLEKVKEQVNARTKTNVD